MWWVILGYIFFSSYLFIIILKINKYRINIILLLTIIEMSQYVLLPLYSFIRLFVYSFDVIHTLGIYSWGIKIDVIPGRINSESSKGIYSIYLFSFPFLIINIITNDFPTTN